MEKRVKFALVGLIGLLLVSLIINLQTFSARQAMQRERDELKRENASLSQQMEASLQDTQRLRDKINSLGLDLEKATKEKDNLQRKFDLVNKERLELVEKLKEQRRPSVPLTSAAPISEDAYWAGILKAKTDLEMQLENVRSDLKTAQINNEQLQREKNELRLEVTSLTRERADLKRQLDYNQKLMDSLAQELVREKNDKFQISETMKSLKSENAVLRRQLQVLDSRKIDLEKRFLDLQKQNQTLDNRLKEMETLLQGKTAQMGELKKQVEGAKESIEGAKESVELPPIVVRPQPETSAAVTSSASASAKILAVNQENNFVIIDLGTNANIKVGDTFKVYRQSKAIADIEVIQTRQNISACDIKKEAAPIKVGDSVR